MLSEEEIRFKQAGYANEIKQREARKERRRQENEKKKHYTRIQKDKQKLKAMEKEIRIQKLKVMPYKEYLQTSHWISLRYRVRQRESNICEECQETSPNMDVHHTTYKNRGDRNKEIDDLVLLCRTCHEKKHSIKKQQQVYLHKVPW